MKITNRSIHRDFAYFYFGLIIAFSFSGIILNHREDWYPMDYVYESKDLNVQLPEDVTKLRDRAFAETFSKNIHPEGEFEGHNFRGESLRLYYKNKAVADIDLKTGKGVLEIKKRMPFVGDTMLLHKSTNNFWIWYSDIFGAAMLLIAITGVLIPMGKNGFKQRGWKLAILGLLFPLIFLFILS